MHSWLSKEGGSQRQLMFGQVSVLPRCQHVSQILDANTPGEACSCFLAASVETIGAIFAQSYLSLAALVGLFMLSFGFAVSGGIGAVPGPMSPLPLQPLSFRDTLALRHAYCTGCFRRPSSLILEILLNKGNMRCRGRTGGLMTQLTAAVLHTATHLTAAIFSIVLLELSIETCIRCVDICSSWGSECECLTPLPPLTQVRAVGLGGLPLAVPLVPGV